MKIKGVVAMRHVVMGALLALSAVLLVSGCSSSSKIYLPPVEDRSSGGKPARVLPGAENAGKPGYYTVKSGDTLIRIGMDAGFSWKEIARWNNLDNPNALEPGQVLRIVPPAQDNAVVVKPIASANVAPTNATPAQAPASAASVAPAPKPAPEAAKPAASEAAEEAVAFKWPAKGNLIAGFDESKNKGLDIAGSAGDPILAAADGRVVYAGAGLRGYGNLIIIKHNNTYLSAYAHNQTLLVKEDQTVKQGQKIAEMGNSDADQVKLHFEIRRQGKPVDPSKYLPN
jgi:lipoprotein NlpD